jgi:hypothetical protein
MDDQPTCGKGLAEHSALPAKVAELEDALAENLETHQKTIAAQLRETARHMAGYRDLPMGRHDERAFADPTLFEAFERFVKVEEELLALLQAAVERDRQLLAAFGGQERGD